jgi:hypothetical protein
VACALEDNVLEVLESPLVLEELNPVDVVDFVTDV